MLAVEELGSTTTTAVEVVVKSLPDAGTDWVSIASIVVSLVVGLLTVGVAAWAVRQANRANDAQLMLDVRQQDAAKMSYGLQVELQELQKRMLRLDEQQIEWGVVDRKPWIQVTHRTERDAIGRGETKFRFENHWLRFTNTGRSPAYNVDFTAEEGDSGEPLSIRLNRGLPADIDIIAPGEFIDIPIKEPEVGDMPYPTIRVQWRDSLDDGSMKGNARQISWF